MKTLATLFLFLSVACSTNSTHQHSATSNDKFLQEDLDVKLWQERFENRDRDVYQNREKIIEALDLQPGQVVADIGAGTGFYLKMISTKVGMTGKVVAVDLSPSFVSFLRARGKKEKINNLEVIQGSVTSTNLPENSIDKIFVVDTYHHFDNKDEMLRDFSTIIKPGGEVIIIDFDSHKKSDTWVAKHTAQTQKDVIDMVSKHFTFVKESKIGLSDNFMLHFKKESNE